SPDQWRQRSAPPGDGARSGCGCILSKTVLAIRGAQETGATPMLIKFSGVCLLAVALLRQAAAQTSPDLQKVLDRLDQLEAENRQLLDQIQELRTELTR